MNKSKGPAVWGPRAQMDRKLYKKHMQETLFNYPNLHIRAASVFDLSVDRSSKDDASTSINHSVHRTGSIAGVRLG